MRHTIMHFEATPHPSDDRGKPYCGICAEPWPCPEYLLRDRGFHYTVVGFREDGTTAIAIGPFKSKMSARDYMAETHPDLHPQRWNIVTMIDPKADFVLAAGA